MSFRYYVYCRGLLGVKTDIPDFKWVYGSDAPPTTEEEYERCKLKLVVRSVKESALPELSSCLEAFQCFRWNPETKTIHYRRELLSHLKIGYDIRIDDNTIEVAVGKNYGNFVTKRVMNLHGMYFLLSDLANVMLLKNGYLTLYASSVYSEANHRGAVFFAPPNTGKTVTAMKLCKKPGYQLLGEDVVITDGERLFACPWTSSYRKPSQFSDSGGALGRTAPDICCDMCESCALTDILLLSRGQVGICTDKEEILHKICTLNGYLFCHYSSPIVKILAYFDKDYRLPWNELAEKKLKSMTERCRCRGIRCEDPAMFDVLADTVISGQ